MTPLGILMRDPHDSSCTVGWDSLTTEEQKRGLRHFKALVKRINIRYLICIQLKGSPTEVEGKWVWPHIIYPLEFISAEDAYDYLHVSPDPALRPEGVKSWCITTNRTAKPFPILEPRVRKEDLVKAPPRKRR